MKKFKKEILNCNSIIDSYNLMDPISETTPLEAQQTIKALKRLKECKKNELIVAIEKEVNYGKV